MASFLICNQHESPCVKKIVAQALKLAIESRHTCKLSGVFSGRHIQKSQDDTTRHGALVG